ncbi:PaaI family thioesterase [Hyphomonas johnsonii]|uniref:Thioesterase family protein n=1 Tax=Hyphomonas johnsonii MHS-2 TaxID=1280950 RepID=A0A059FV92_9PROT|nr:PaaI family thioesterase [Hyphomonas johnsonii]KCZ94431.1 thioesterase family protein [Hyphomonas johnsonii MHS-2]
MNEPQGALKPPPAGFAPNPSRGKFTLHNGPTYRASARGDIRTGMWVLDRHCNGMGFLHGGMASAFSDSALAWAVWSATGRMSVTIKLTLEFMDIVPEGTWLEAHPEVTAIDGDLVHVRARLVKSDGHIAARADAVFRSLRRRAT